ncbi:5103_t:CDS:2 [Funneliformis geosporum]|uniref:Selenoprotein O n=1 Tax=Funneliformis geosporum TaxID=1117311 RepID=A0A9W4SJT2_9GLOM|nr:18814_t:CDS:2 [Funneliformis geosporum]CAI2179667.1 5103_t:CDS:2 [Funneliformis geosporum]
MSKSSIKNLDNITKSFVFTKRLPSDEAIPSLNTTESQRTSRPIKKAAFTYVVPEPVKEPKLLAIAEKTAKEILNLEEINNWSEEQKTEFLEVVSGNRIVKGTFPWAHCYGGHQFGFFAGQLGDGRVISLFEAINDKNERWELQLKGVGKTPFSRAADGLAVLRSSIREFLGSEAMAALDVPTTRVLSIVHTPKRMVQREVLETGSIVCRLSPSWIRFGSFEIFFYRMERKQLRSLTDFVVEEVYGLKSLENPEYEKYGNRYGRLFNQISRKTARMVAHWQAIGFCHGVMNTDNMSILGLTIDYGPFAFLDIYDSNWICNHSDYEGRYSFRNQPTACLWNLLKLSHTFQELIGAGDEVDKQWFLDANYPNEKGNDFPSMKDKIIRKGKEIIDLVLGEFQEIFLEEYEKIMMKKLGFQTLQQTDLEIIITPLLNFLATHLVDYHHFFRLLCSFSTTTSNSSSIFIKDLLTRSVDLEKALSDFNSWFEIYKQRLISEDSNDLNRSIKMKQINPKFVLRNWIAEEVIKRVERGDSEILKRVLQMCENPFKEWGVDPSEFQQEAARFCGDVPAVRFTNYFEIMFLIN